MKKLFNLGGLFRSVKVETKPAKDTTISGKGNNHTITHWHDDCYMDDKGYVYTVKRKKYVN